MYIRLKNNYALRGWKGLPFALTDITTGQTMFLNKSGFEAAMACNGTSPLIFPFVSPDVQQNADKFIEHGFAERIDSPLALAGYQQYRKSEGRFAELVHWSITGHCNLKCRHCYMSAPEAKYGELSTEQCLHIVDQIAAANIGKVSLTGGEPLLRQDFWQIVDALLEHRIVISEIYTNGVLMSDAFLEHLKKRYINCTIVLSFDCCNSHDWVRGIPGAEKKAIAAIKRARLHDFAVTIETALHKGNLDQLIPTYNLLKQLGVQSWKVSAMVNTGNWTRENGQYDLSYEDLYDAYLDLATQHQDDHCPLNMMLGGVYFARKGDTGYMSPFNKFNGLEEAVRQTVCRSCRIHMHIMADGTLLPCVPMTGTYIENQMPNLTCSTISHALSGSQYFDLINTKMESLFAQNQECAACEHRLKCGGGCRASAINHAAGFFGKDPDSCYFFQNGYDKKLEQKLGKKPYSPMDIRQEDRQQKAASG